MFKKAVQWKLMEKSPFSDEDTLILNEENRRLRYLERKEIERLLTECRHLPYLYRIVVCALNTGMRRGEILSLKWEQIKKDTIYLQKTKNGEERQIPVFRPMRNLLILLVGARGFEPPTPCSQSRCATRLRHAPNMLEI